VDEVGDISMYVPVLIGTVLAQHIVSAGVLT